jgi:hypothetical protein
MSDSTGAPAFDTRQRFRAIERTLGAAVADGWQPDTEPWQVLDVGGFPGTLGTLLTENHGLKTLTLDTPECDRPDYQQGTGERIEADDEAFACVVASDTLEHIPPDGRAAFLSELVRVARDRVILSGPLYTRIADEAESHLNSMWEQQTKRPHRWLSEHREYGLPRAEEIAAAFAPHGKSTWEPNGWLPNWMLLMGQTFLDELRPQSSPNDSLAGTANSVYSLYTDTMGYNEDGVLPCYRYVVTLDKQQPGSPESEAAALVPPEFSGDEDGMRYPCERLLIQLLNVMFNQLAAAPTAGTEGTAQGGVDLAYVESLEKASWLVLQNASEQQKSQQHLLKQKSLMQRLKRKFGGG